MKKVLIPIFFLTLITLPTLFSFFNARFFYTQDYIFIARLQQMSSALLSGQFPVRWAPDLRYGEPLFNFYAPLPYYLGAVIHLLGFNFIWVAKILFMLTSLLSAAAIYLLANRLFGRKAGVLAAVLYTYAPYKAVDMYVRGSLSETWAFVFFPLIFYSSLVLSEKVNLKNLSLLALSLAGLFLTHNVTILMFLPFLFLWWVYLVLREKKWKILVYLVLAFVLGFGLAAFFLLPAFFENSFIQTKYLTVGYFDFRAHFVAFSQFFSTFWGYGVSGYGSNDGLSFQVGSVHWVVILLTIICGFILRRNKKLLGILLFLGLSFFLSLLLQHTKSDFIWETIPLMAFIQFPWRFLAISIFIVSIVGAALAGNFQGRFKVAYFVLITAVVLVNIGYFKPKEYVDDKFFDKFLHIENMHRGEDLTKDYLPIWVQTTDGERFDAPRVQTGEIKIANLEQTSTMLGFSAVVGSTSLIEIPITYFPGWEVRVNNQLISQNPPSEMGLIRFDLPKGSYQITVELKDTLVRALGNIISLFSLLIIFVSFFIRKKYLHA